MSIYYGYKSSSSKVSRFNIIKKSESKDNTIAPTTANESNSALVVQKPDQNLKKFRKLWWEEGIMHPQAKWEEATLPYVLAEEITSEEYEKRTDEFNIRGLWEWDNYKVTIYELPLRHHEAFVSSIDRAIAIICGPLYGTNASLYGLGATRTCANNSRKEADANFRPAKQLVRSPDGSDGKNEPWPNLVIEVAYSESIQHVLDKVKNYWLANTNRVHDAIVIKIDPVSSDKIPTRMQAWHFCIADKQLGTQDISHRTYFEFGTHDKYGNPTNVQQGQCVIKISLDCLYHNTLPDVIIHRQVLPDPIILDFLKIRNEFIGTYRT